ncbi:MAG TPA: hypothetical protein VGL21_01990 [Jatrophihabitantaceae bacterium]
MSDPGRVAAARIRYRLIQLRGARPKWDRTTRVVSAVTVAATGVTVGLIALRPVGGATPTTIDSRVGQAVSYAKSLGVASAVAVLDDKTGKLYTAGNALTSYGSASVMKLFVATKLLATGKMSNPSIAAKAYSMITRSDDKAVNALLPLVGGTSVVNWVKARYGITYLGAPSPKAGCWGATQITARGIAYFYSRMKRDSRVAPWLLNALHHYQGYAADGTNQTFGIPQATSNVGVKQGWGSRCSSNTNGTVINSTGLVAGNRFDVVILSNTNKWGPNSLGYNPTQAYAVSQMAKLLMPNRAIDLPESHNPVGHVDSMTATGTTVTVKGWAMDPDIRTGAMQVRVTEGTGIKWQHSTSLPRADVNRALHTTGNHGFVAEFTAGKGKHAYCVRFLNTGMGNSNPTVCHIVTVPGAPPSSPPPSPPSTPPPGAPASARPGAPPVTARPSTTTPRTTKAANPKPSTATSASPPPTKPTQSTKPTRATTPPPTGAPPASTTPAGSPPAEPPGTP